MNTRTFQSTENRKQSNFSKTPTKNSGIKSAFKISDNRKETSAQHQLYSMANKGTTDNFTVQLQSVFNKPLQKQALDDEELIQGKFKTIQKQEIEEEELIQGKFRSIQKKENKTGLPDNLKSGIENLSGMDMDDVKVHYNSDKPGKLHAHAYAQGTDIHVAPGQEKHLPHEAWHVVQQKQGRVKPTMQMKGSVNVNDDAGLEKEADLMGAKVLTESMSINHPLQLKTNKKSERTSGNILQYVKDEDVRQVITDPLMQNLYDSIIPIFKQIAEMPVVAEEKAAQGEEKGEALAEGASEKFEQLWQALTHPEEAIQAKAEEAAKKALKKYWKSLSTEEQIELALEGVGSAVSILKNLGEVATSGDIDSGRSGRSGGGLFGKLRIGGSKGGSEVSKAFIEGMSQISADDLKSLWRVWQEKKKAQQEMEEARSDFDDAMKKLGGWGGKKIGKMQGSVADFLMQRKLKTLLKSELSPLIERYEFVRAKILENEDSDWYNDELAVYDHSIRNIGLISGPMLVLISSDPLDLEGLESCKKKAKSLMDDLVSARSERELAAKGGGLVNKVKKVLGF